MLLYNFKKFLLRACRKSGWHLNFLRLVLGRPPNNRLFRLLSQCFPKDYLCTTPYAELGTYDVSRIYQGYSPSFHPHRKTPRSLLLLPLVPSGYVEIPSPRFGRGRA